MTNNFEKLLLETRELSQATTIQGVPVFDEHYYLETYPDISGSGIDPFQHYMKFGWVEGRNPSKYFNTRYYIEENMPSNDVNPVLHYLSVGRHVGVSTYDLELNNFITNEDIIEAITAEFDEEFYLEKYPDVASSMYKPVEHYVRFGSIERRDPRADFSTEYYVMKYGRELGADTNPFFHYVTVGRSKGYKISPSRMAGISVTSSQVTATEAPEVRQFDLYGTILASNLFDEDYYVLENPDLHDIGDKLEHYITNGEREGRKPNFFFNPGWYAKKYGLEGAHIINLLFHYIETGEKDGFKPSPYFDPSWYAEKYSIASSSISALGHFLGQRKEGRNSPNKYFSTEYYRRTSPDVVKAGVDPFIHFARNGVFEKRKCSDNFDQDFVWDKYLGGDRLINPFEQFLDVGEDLGWAAVPTKVNTSPHEEIRKNCAPGTMFEARPISADGHRLRTKAVAFYLPQFHPIPENDEWWGVGFTEWRNVMRGAPRFSGHFQPRVPRDLGFYDLNDGVTLKRQVELAKASGLHGFCFYYYNFNGRRLLEKPLNAYVEHPEIDFPFCLMWANENWSRRWDGFENDVLIRQDYRHDDASELVDDLAYYMKQGTYITAEGRPLLFIYRADIIPDCEKTLNLWRQLFKERHALEPLIILTQAFGCNDPTDFGFDGAIEFPPHKLSADLPEIRNELDILDPNFKGYVRRYDDLVEASLNDVDNPFPLIKTAVPLWDNDARKQGEGLCFHGSTPKKFETWLSKLIVHARNKPFWGEPFVFINAWNEWAEGCYLEPDCHNGYAYLNAMTRAVHEPIFPQPTSERSKLVLVGHDAHPHGAQILLLNIGRILKDRFGLDIHYILMGDGPLVKQYEKSASTYVVTTQSAEEIAAHIDSLREDGFKFAITNSAVSGLGAKALKKGGFQVTSLIHELPEILRDNLLVENYEAIRDNSDMVVFPNTYVKHHIENAFGKPKHDVTIRPQGLYSQIQFSAKGRRKIRDELKLTDSDRVVINVAFGDKRKGLDLFTEIAIKVGQLATDVHFVWVGALHQSFSEEVNETYGFSEIPNLHFIPFSPNLADYLSAADLFLLTSREDPFPSVLLDAMAVGLPVAAFEDAGGYVDLFSNSKIGTLIPYLNTDAASASVLRILDSKEYYSESYVAERQSIISKEYNFARYCADLVRMSGVSMESVSVVVPNYNYASYLPSRLDSIRHQTYPVFETIVLDDLSPDNSLDALNRYARETNFSFEVVPNEVNSGSGYRQWDKGALLSEGDFVWIAEADDLASPDFLAEAMAMLTTSDAGFVFCDSIQIDEFNNELADSYSYNFDSIEPGAFQHNFVMDGPEFVRRFLSVKNIIMNVSGVVWRKSVLLKVLEETRALHSVMRVACDWKMYAIAGMKYGSVGYIAKSLNIHRRHSLSVTHSRNAQQHYDEIVGVQEFVESELNINADLIEKREEYRAEVKIYLGV